MNTVHLYIFLIFLVAVAACNDDDPGNPAAVSTQELFLEKKGDTSLPSSDEELQKLISFDKSNYEYSVEDFFRNPQKLYFKLSPNGQYLSYLAPVNNRMNVFVQKLGEDEAVQVTSSLDRDIHWYMWANNNRILYLQDKYGDENFKLFAVDRNGENQKSLTPFEDVRVQVIDELQDKEEEIIIVMNKNKKEVFDPYRLNIETGELELLYTNPGNITHWKTDHDGNLRLAIVADGVNQTLLHRKTEQDPFDTVYSLSFRENVEPLFFTFDNKNIYGLSNLNRDKMALVEYDLEEGKEIGKPLFIHPEVDVMYASYSKKRKKLTSVHYVTDKRQVEFFDDEVEAIYQTIQDQIGQYEVAITGHDRAENKFLIRTYSDRSLGAYYVYNKLTDSLFKITDISPWLDENDMAEMRPVKYTSRDGLTIHGYLSLPYDSARNVPVVVLPHGGPWSRDYWGYNPEVQLLTSRGYAVFQMNFRGSIGYGNKFWEAGFKEWGHAMQNDITDGVNWLIRKGVADEDKIAIYGASYGGYAALSGLAFTPDIYACGVDYVGVSNLFTFLKTIPPYWKPMVEMMYEMVGHPVQDSVYLKAASPVFHVDKIKAPLLVVQGANDPRVNIDESDQMVRALRDRGVEVPYMVKYTEGHGFRNEENRIEVYKVMVGFLAKHLRNQKSVK